MAFGKFPYTGSLKALHSWAPGLEAQQDFLSELIENARPRSYDIALPITCFGSMTTTGGLVEIAQYQTLEPLAKIMYVEILISGITRGGVASSSMFIPLPPIANANYNTAILPGDGLNAAGVEMILGRPISGVEPNFVAVQRYNGGSWSLDAGNYVRLSGVVKYG